MNRIVLLLLFAIQILIPLERVGSHNSEEQFFPTPTYIYTDPTDLCKYHIVLQIAVWNNDGVNIQQDVQWVQTLLNEQFALARNCCRLCNSAGQGNKKGCRADIRAVVRAKNSLTPDALLKFHEIKIVGGEFRSEVRVPLPPIYNQRKTGTWNRNIEYRAEFAHEAMHLAALDDQYCERIWWKKYDLSSFVYVIKSELKLPCRNSPTPGGGLCCSQPRTLTGNCTNDCPGFENDLMSSGNMNCHNLDSILNRAGQICPRLNCCECIITGPSHLLKSVTQQYIQDSLKGGYWDYWLYEGATASIVLQNERAVIVNSGNTRGRFRLQYLKRFCEDDFYIPVCEKWVSVDTPLPVELLSFTAFQNQNYVSLFWKSQAESNNSGFEIQRSSINENWAILGFVKGAGNSTEPKNYTFEDKNLSSGIYHYRLKQIDFNGNFEYFELPEAVTIGVPDKFFLEQNYPNPFNPVTTIVYGMPEAGKVMLKVFDMSGREVKTLINEPKEAGYYTVKFDAGGLASGAYFYKIESGNYVAVKKMVLLK